MSRDQAPTRDRILGAAARVIREQGLAQTTTKEIARAAGLSEGSIYNHFESKMALIAATMGELTSGIRQAMVTLLGRVGEGSVEANLADVVEAQVRFYLELLPIVGPTLGNRELLGWLRRGGPTPDAAAPPGPALGHAGVIAYLDEEQRRGRLAAEAQPASLTAALLGASLGYAFLTLLTSSEGIAGLARLPTDPGAYARVLVPAVVAQHLRPSGVTPA